MYSRGAVKTTMTIKQQFMDCEKVLLKNLWDMEGVWYGKYAQWFENCHRTSAGKATSDDPPVTYKIWDKEWVAQQKDWIWAGTLDPKSVSWCYNIPGLASLAQPTVAAPSPSGEDMVLANESYNPVFA